MEQEVKCGKLLYHIQSLTLSVQVHYSRIRYDAALEDCTEEHVKLLKTIDADLKAIEKAYATSHLDHFAGKAKIVAFRSAMDKLLTDLAHAFRQLGTRKQAFDRLEKRAELLYQRLRDYLNKGCTRA